MKRYMVLATAALAVATALGATSVMRWGYRGHEMTGHAAAANLPKDMPEFFRKSVAQLTYLNPEPDRWRAPDSLSREMNQAFQYDHYVDLEALPAGALDARDRWDYWARAQAGGVTKVGDAGFLPYRILELYERLEHEFQLWRNAKDEHQREFIEQRIINDAGIMGHYVADAANPHHTTVHHDRWADGYPNPNNYTTEKGFHSRFESKYVETHIEDEDVIRLTRDPQRVGDVRAAVLQHINSSHALLNQLYDLNKQEAFGPDTKSAAHKQFTVDRLAAGANVLRDLWWTAWVKSGEPGAH
ncbi:MAG: hypothetical protein ABIS27_02560 [Longimicrobiales bacterium]